MTEGLGDGGQVLYEALSGEDPARNALALEAARIKDRLDELDRIIHGDGVLELMQFKLQGAAEEVVEVSFQNVLAEARQHATAFSALLKSLGAEGAAKPAPVEASASGQTRLEQLRAARNAGGV